MAGFSDSNTGYFNDQTASADIINFVTGVQGALTVGIAAVEIRVGGSRLEGRKLVTLYNNSNSTIYWGWTNAVTISTGTPIEKKQQAEWSVGDAISIWVIAGVAANNTRITEAG